MVGRAANRELEDFIATCKTIAGGEKSHGSIEMVRGQCGIGRKGDPYPSRALRAQEIRDVREEVSCDSSASITVLDREPYYLSGRICNAVTLNARVMQTFPAF
jgi:hypothetical protein